MDDGVIVKDTMDVDQNNDTGPQPDENGSTGRSDPLNSTFEGRNHVRAASVDMLGNEHNQSSSDSRTESLAATSASNQGSTTSVTSVGGSPSSAVLDTLERKPGPSIPFPSLDEQVSQVTKLNMQALEEGAEGYVISQRWLIRVLARTSDGIAQIDFDKSALEGDIGPVDNSDLIIPEQDAQLKDERGKQFIQLKPGLQMGEDFEVFPTEAWEKVMAWYTIKPGTEPVIRYVQNTAHEGIISNLQYEIYPPIFTIQKVKNNSQTSEDKAQLSQPAPRLLASRSTSFQQFLKAAKTTASIPMTTKVQIWRLIEEVEQLSQVPGVLTPATSRSGSPVFGPAQNVPKLELDSQRLTSMVEGTQRDLVDVKDETANDKYNGRLRLGTVGLSQDQTLVLEEQVGGPGGGEFVTDATRLPKVKASGSSLLNIVSGKIAGQKVGSDSGRSSPTPLGPVTRGRTRRDGRTKGTVGLTNLGNTCYMNSALQCIRSVEELTVYFLQERYKKDINADNPLGHSGQIAKSYAGLLAQFYTDGALSFAPKNFKNVLGRAQPMFSGYGQQDSQEFLSFLVDGLHEDLNRILKKPYVENPESDDKMVNDPEAIRLLGEKFREIHHARNDSVAMDLFNGFYKNTMVCPICDKVSITFDPYSLLTLQLPIDSPFQHTIIFVPLNSFPIKVDVDMDKNSTIKMLKQYVCQRVPGTDWTKIMATEVYTSKFYRFFEDSKSLAEYTIQPRDELVLYELPDTPTNYPPPKKRRTKYRPTISLGVGSSDEETPESDSPLADRMLVPIFHRLPGATTYSIQKGLKLWPSFVILNREEAKSYDEILRKVLQRTSVMTSRGFKNIVSEMASNDNDHSPEGSDVVVTEEADASSNLDSGVRLDSIENGSVVEVSMSDEQGGEEIRNKPEESQTSRISFLRPGEFIPAELQSMFEMKYVKKGSEMIATGWSTIEQAKDYPLIASRIPVSQSRRSSVQSQGSQTNSESSDGNNDDSVAFSNPGTYDNGMDTDDSLPSNPENFSSRSRQSARGRKSRGGWNKRTVKNGRKGKNKHGYSGRSYHEGYRQPSETPSEQDDNPALVRLGEAIVLDWHPNAYDTLFGAYDDSDEWRGIDTFKLTQTIEDSEVQERKARRAARKKSGITLEECFAETAKGEILSEDNAWYCNRCKELRRAKKTLEIWTVPDILVIHLKRFGANRGFRDKIDVHVDFPTNDLDISSMVGLPEGKEMKYDLFAVDNHYGGLGGGHYTAFAQNFFDKRWYEYNDSMVSQRDAMQTVTPAAYLLFYRRRSPTPLGPIYLRKLVEEFHDPPASTEQSQPESPASSRQTSQSPSGKGQRLDGLSPNGSSSASAVVGRREGGSSGGAAARRVVSGPKTTMATAGPPADQTNGRSTITHCEEDEGISGMGDSDEDRQYGLTPNSTWSFNRIGPVPATASQSSSPMPMSGIQVANTPPEDQSGLPLLSAESDDDPFNHANSDLGTDELDTLSNNPALGDDLKSRLIEDFGDSMVGESNQPFIAVEVGESVGASTSGSLVASRGDTPEEEPDEEMPELVGVPAKNGGEERQAPLKGEVIASAEKRKEDVKMD